MTNNAENLRASINGKKIEPNLLINKSDVSRLTNSLGKVRNSQKHHDGDSISQSGHPVSNSQDLSVVDFANLASNQKSETLKIVNEFRDEKS